ncbi:MAG: SbcC/MukB-like Walker B domain-containing protein [Verrucomicrobia bacterium]|nr:SbcC/MukB-like Walker B domain-containing protein [Verrucomicrobiota bacterium]
MMLESQLELEFSPDKSTAGYRLHALSLLNWGTFNQTVHTMRSDGRTSMITGRNGSGKSTIVDALLTLLVPNRVRNYNVASSQVGSRERNERDYILGSYSEIHDSETGQGRKETLRKPGESYSVLLAWFYNEAYKSDVTLAQVLWCTPAGKIEKIHIVEKRHLTIENDFNDLGDADKIRKIIKERNLTTFDSFTAYNKKWESMLFMDMDLGTRSPMSVFNQAVCIKDVRDLTQFIREHMLDDGGAREKLVALQARFDDLRGTHRRIETAASQLDELDQIKGTHEKFIESLTQRDRAELLRSTIEPFYANAELESRIERIEELKHREEAERARLKSSREEVDHLREKVHHLERVLSDSDENRRLEQVGAELDRLRDKREMVSKRAATFERLLGSWVRGLVVKEEEAFLDLRHELQEKLPRHEARVSELDEVLPDLGYSLRNTNEIISKLEAQRSHLLEGNSNVPVELSRLRDSLAVALDRDVGELPFIAELVQLVPDEQKWTGVIERLLRPFALSVLVPSKLAQKAEAFLHENELGNRLAFVCPKSDSKQPKLHDDSVVAKLTLRTELDESRQNWLRAELADRFPHLCRNEPDKEFNKMPHALCLSGLVKTDGVLREKDDRYPVEDASRHILGWDVDPKQRSLDERLAFLRERADEAARAVREADSERTDLRLKLKAGAQLVSSAGEFSDVDRLGIATRMADLEDEERVIVGGSDVLRKLKEDLDSTSRKLSDSQELRDEILRRIGGVEARAERNEDRITNLRSLLDDARKELQIPEAVKGIEDDDGETQRENVVEALFQEIEDAFGVPPEEPDDIESAARNALHSMEDEIRKLESSLDKFRDQNVAAMQRFVAAPQNQAFRDELPLDLEEGYNEKTFDPFEEVRKQIELEDLAKNKERFEQLLRVQVPEEVSSFSEALESHRDRIRKRIDELNEHLSRVTFDRKEGTYIQLKAEDSGDDGVRRFKTMRRHALEGDLEAEEERDRRRERYHRVEQFLAELENDESWTSRVIDVRNWFRFRADEFYKEGDLRQSYSGASGKSGGEKNRLASTILATAIAYQYGIDVGGRRTETFRLVAVDEMFSKTDDEFSEFLLDLFKEFHLQLLIVQPLDAKIHVVQKYVERYHVVERRDGVSFVGDLSVKEYLNEQTETDEEAVSAETE